MVNQGDSKIQVLKQISIGVMRHPIPFKKFNKNAKQIREDISKGTALFVGGKLCQIKLEWSDIIKVAKNQIKIKKAVI